MIRENNDPGAKNFIPRIRKGTTGRKGWRLTDGAAPHGSLHPSLVGAHFEPAGIAKGTRPDYKGKHQGS